MVLLTIQLSGPKQLCFQLSSDAGRHGMHPIKGAKIIKPAACFHQCINPTRVLRQ